MTQVLTLPPRVVKQQYHARRSVVLFAAFLILFSVIGFNITILYQEFLLEFQRSTTETSLIQSVNLGTMYCISTLSGICVEKAGPRVTGLVAGSFYCIGILLSYFATSIFHLTLTLGFVTGMGMSGASVACTTVIGQYYSGKSRSYAVSFVYFGSGVGSIVFTYLVDFLINEYGWRGCLLIVSALMANLIPYFLLCEPNTKKTPEPLIPNGILSMEETTNVDLSTKVKIILKNADFLITAVGIALSLASHFAVVMSVTDVLALKDFPRPKIVLLLSIMQISSMFSRLLTGLYKRIPHVSVVALPAIYSATGCAVFVAFPVATKVWQNIVLLSLFGMSFGGTMVSMSLTTYKITRTSEYPVAIGMLMTMAGICCTTFGPLAGYLRSATGSYTASFYGMAGFLGLAFVMFSVVLIRRKLCHNT